jgi:hypothetical protein
MPISFSLFPTNHSPDIFKALIENSSKNFFFFSKATDPEGGQVSYYAYSGKTVDAAGELHTVTRDGVISISAIVPPAGVANPGVGANGGAAGATLPDVNAGTAPVDVFIVAVDAVGASSVLQARFFLACGEVVT